ncbi:MAG: hypothetical protein AB1439_02995 [candidate division FCPU426 bacterium]
MDLWTQLIQQVDQLISALRQTREEAKKWRTRALEAERLRVKDDRAGTLQTQSLEREIERLYKERKKAIAIIGRLIGELEHAQAGIVEQIKNE